MDDKEHQRVNTHVTDFLAGLLDAYAEAYRDREARLRQYPHLMGTPDWRLQDAERALARYVYLARDYLRLETPEGFGDKPIESDGMISRPILFFGQPCTLACDARCHKAWGGSQRPRLYRAASGAYNLPKDAVDEPPDENDYVYLSDGELGEAPALPGTWEGEHTKPQAPEERLNKWCARECERSELVDLGEPVVLPDFTQRHYNKAPHTRNGKDKS